jgi:ectoine hydroxylase-related dioxygenase (phytanoyl-CoA dioxygenase family)
MKTVRASFVTNGFAVVESVPVASVSIPKNLTSASSGSRRLLAEPWCASLAQSLRARTGTSCLIPNSHVAVQCTFFEKSAVKNWLVPIHQDLSIPVLERVAHPGLRGWSSKEGVLFVQARTALLRQLIAVRWHVDDCAANDGPLFVVPGSHKCGLMSPESAVAARTTEVPCLVAQGSALVMRPLLLHRSPKSSGGSRRRVLQFLFGPKQLPYGLTWAHAV